MTVGIVAVGDDEQLLPDTVTWLGALHGHCQMYLISVVRAICIPFIFHNAEISQSWWWLVAGDNDRRAGASGGRQVRRLDS